MDDFSGRRRIFFQIRIVSFLYAKAAPENFFYKSAEKIDYCPFRVREVDKTSGNGGNAMQENPDRAVEDQMNDELADVLTAIAVVAKRLARNLRKMTKEGGSEDGSEN